MFIQYKEYSYSKYTKEDKDSQEKTTRKQGSIGLTEKAGRNKSIYSRRNKKARVEQRIQEKNKYRDKKRIQAGMTKKTEEYM